MKRKNKNVPLGPGLFGTTTFFSLGPFLFAKRSFPFAKRNGPNGKRNGPNTKKEENSEKETSINRWK